MATIIATTKTGPKSDAILLSWYKRVTSAQTVTPAEVEARLKQEIQATLQRLISEESERMAQEQRRATELPAILAEVTVT